MAAKTLLEEICEYAQAGDENLMPAVLRFMEAEEKRKRRSRRPVDFAILRLDLSKFPFPIIARPTYLGDVEGIQFRMLIEGEQLGFDVHLSEFVLRDENVDFVGRALHAALFELWREAFERVVTIRSVEETDKLLEERELERGYENDRSIRSISEVKR